MEVHYLCQEKRRWEDQKGLRPKSEGRNNFRITTLLRKSFINNLYWGFRIRGYDSRKIIGGKRNGKKEV